jgi:hypothetical protein
MSETTVYTRATRAELLAILSRLPEEARGGSPAAQNMMTRCGVAALTRIHAAFIVKSRGGTDESGERWRPLSPITIAYRRRHRGVPPPKDRAAKRPSWALSDEQRERWWYLYRRGLAKHATRTATERIVTKETKAAAARAAWTTLKSEGAQTLFDKYAHAQVNILDDTGVLLDSLTPESSAPEQVFRVTPGQVEVGSNRVGASGHHAGIPGKLPQRRLWPAVGRWPASWWVDLLEQGRIGLMEIIFQLLRE